MWKSVLIIFSVFCLPAQEPAKAKPNFFGLAPPPDPAAVQRGQALFVANCGFCHGSTAKGGNGGPDLVRSALVLRDEGSAIALGPVILEGRPSKGMPKISLTPAQIKDVAAFLLSLSQATVNRGEYKILNVITGNAKAGLAYFQQHCAACHSATGDLAGVAGRYDPPALQARFLYPKGRQSARSQVRATVTLPSGESVSGIVNAIDDFSIAIVDASGRYRSWLLDESLDEGSIKVALQDPLSGHEQLVKLYTDTDMHNVLAYLETLK